MLRKSTISLAVIGVLNAIHANALGLGDVQISSALNEPLRAEVDLLQLRGLNASQIITSLADTDDFYLAGVKPTAILSDIRFKLDIKGGNGKIILTTESPIKEPFLNFLIEVNWPSGRLVREYTVLLDPPVFTADDLAPQVQPVAPVARSKPAAEVAAASGKRPLTRTTGSMTVGPGKYHVKNNDTLWQIALKTRPDAAISPQQMMLAILQANPSAFFDNNINRLKSGVVLAIPSKAQISGTSPGDSLQEVKRQNSSWKGGAATATAKSAATLDADKAAMPSTAVSPTEDAQLRIVSKAAEETPVAAKPAAAVASETSEVASTIDPVTGGELVAKNEQLEEQLVVTLEGLDKVERDNAEMFERLDRLTEQMESMARLVELKDQQLAQLQTQLAQKQAAPVAPVAPDAGPASLPMELIAGAAVAVLALLAGLFAFMRKRRQDEEVEEALVVLNEQDDDAAKTDVDAQAAAPVGLDEPSESVSELDQLDASELDDLSLDEDSDDPFNMASDDSAVADGSLLADGSDSADEFDAISDAELDDALGNDLDMDLKLDEPIAEDSEMDAFSNSLLDDDEYNLSTGLDEDKEATVDIGADLDSDLDALLAEGSDDISMADEGADESIVELETESKSEPLDAVTDELDGDFGSDLDDLLAEDSAEEDMSLDALLAEADVSGVDEPVVESVEEALDEELMPDNEALDALFSAAETGPVEDLDAVEAASEEVDIDALEVGELPEQMLTVDDIETGAEFELPSEEVDSSVEQDLAIDSAMVLESELDDEAGLDLELSSEFDLSADLSDLAVETGTETETETEVEAQATVSTDDIVLDLDLDLDDAADDALDFSVESDGSEVEGNLDALLQQAESDAQTSAVPKSTLSLEDDLDGAGDAELEAELEQMLEAEDNALSLQETDLDADEVNYLDSADEVGTKIDLARAYIDMDDLDGARDILQEVLSEGSSDQITEANQLLENMKS